MFDTIKEFWYKSALRKAEAKVLQNSRQRKALQAKHLASVAEFERLRAIVSGY